MNVTTEMCQNTHYLIMQKLINVIMGMDQHQQHRIRSLRMVPDNVIINECDDGNVVTSTTSGKVSNNAIISESDNGNGLTATISDKISEDVIM